MKRKLLLALWALPFIGSSQLNLHKAGQTFTVDFNDSYSDVNVGSYDGSGFESLPDTGQLDSDAWEFSSMAGSASFGDSSAYPEAAGGSSNGGVSVDGFYAFNLASSGSNPAFGWQSSSTNFDPGTVTLKVINNTGSSLNTFRLGFLCAFLNDQNNAVGVSVSYSFDNIVFTAIPALGHSSVETADALGWQSERKTTVVQGVSWADGDSLYLQFQSDYLSGSGSSYDEVAIDDISLAGYAADFVWDGSSWSPNQPFGPQGSSNALVLAGGVAPLSTPTTLANLYVAPGGQLEIDPAVSLTVNQQVIFEAEYMNYSQLKGEIVNDSARYEVYLDSTVAGRWYNFASAVDGQASDLSGIPIAATGVAATTNLWYYDPAVDSDGNGEGDWLPAGSGSFELRGKGLQIYAGDGSYFGDAPFTVSCRGTLNNGDLKVAVSDATTEDWNLLPNPYPSTLNFDSLYQGTANLGATYYMQDGTPDTDPNSSTDQVWRSYNSATALGDGGPYIAPGMSYFVKYNGSADSISFKNNYRSLDTVVERFAQAPAYPIIALEVMHQQSGRTDKTVLFFDAAFDDSEDIRFDGVKLMNTGYPNLYTQSGSKNYQYNALSDQFTTKSVAMNFSADSDGNYKLALDLDAVPAAWSLELEDLLTGSRHNLRGGAYSFNHLVANDSERFMLHINNNGVGEAEMEVADIYCYTKGNTLIVEASQLENASLRVYSLNGKKLFESESFSAREEIDMASWPKAVYLLELKLGAEVLYSRKIVK